ncbi:MAG: hypothetical protein AABW81_01590 [Nanoarchaeota archaeon]
MASEFKDPKDKELYEKIKSLNITEFSRDLFLEVYGSKKIFSKNQYFYLYGIVAEEGGFPNNITYAEFRKKHEEKFNEHLNNLRECIDAGINIFNHRNNEN